MPPAGAAPPVSTLLEGVSVVLRGFFNPAILSPAWLLHQRLIGQDDFDNAEIEIINSSVAAFSTGWLVCQVTNDRMQFSTTDAADFERVRDVAVGVLNTLPHTPIAALGVNREVHLQVKNQKVWHDIGDELLPKDFWEGSLQLPGMRSIAVEGVRADLFDGRVVVQVEPSLRMPRGVDVAHNDHYTLHRTKKIGTSRQEFGPGVNESELSEASAEKLVVAIEILADHWMDSMARAGSVFAKVRELSRTLAGDTQ